LITLESLCLLGIVVKKLYNDLLLLNVDDPESLVREWGNQRRSFGEVVKFIKERAPAHAKRHINQELVGG